ncbi:hypothetical protein Rs2_29982 [Raphanus sativus]|nr:hypothetical protein Rs2_29982 [Raphanus sativus]
MKGESWGRFHFQKSRRGSHRGGGRNHRLFRNSLVAGLVGEPKETDDFTKNLVSLTLSHVKVEVDLTKPLPRVVEFERQSGEVVEVLVDYLWIPPTCAHCHELGHIQKNCFLYSPLEGTQDDSTAKGK